MLKHTKELRDIAIYASEHYHEIRGNAVWRTWTRAINTVIISYRDQDKERCSAFENMYEFSAVLPKRMLTPFREEAKAKKSFDCAALLNISESSWYKWREEYLREVTIAWLELQIEAAGINLRDKIPSAYTARAG